MDSIQLGNGAVDLSRGVVVRDGQEQALSEREVAILRFLAQHLNQDVTREALLSAVWKASDPSSRAVDTAMRRLRVKLEPDPSNPAHLITVHGVGYRLVPARVAAKSPASVPRPDTSFVGRSAELARTRELLVAGARLVTITGPPGMGKTRLAQQLAGRIQQAFSGGVFLVALARVRTLPAVLRSVASAVGISLTGPGDLVARLGEALSGRGPVLLVLDNVDGVADLTPQTVDAWLATAPEVRLLATSRGRLRSSLEAVVEVHPLGEDDAIALFVDRARRARAGYLPSPEERRQIAEIGRRLDGLPLAIELAAARTRVLGPKQILDRLDARFRLLAGPGGALRASIDQSWELLPEPLRRVFAASSVFAGGFDPDAAEAVLGPGAVQAVEELVDRSLVVRVDSDRFDLLESLRAYARERLTEPARSEVVARHAAWYAELGEELSYHLEEHGGMARLARLEQELDNLLAIQRRLIDEAPILAARAIYAAMSVLQRRGPFGLGLDHLNEVLQRPLPDDLRARLLINRAYVLRRMGSMERAFTDFHEVLDLTDRSEDRYLRAMALGNLANLHVERGTVSEARPLAEQALALHRELGSRRAEGVVLGDLAVISKLLGDRDRARTLYEEALTIHEEVGNRLAEGTLLGNLAILSAERGDLEHAEVLMLRALALHREVRNRRPEGVVLGNLGQLAEQRGDLEEAEARYEAALVIHREMGNNRLVTIVLGNLAELDVRRARLASAEVRLHEAIGLNQQIGNQRDEGTLRTVLAAVRWRQGRLDQAEQLYQQALDCFDAVTGADDRAALASAYLGGLAATRGALSQAEAALAEAARVLGAGHPLLDVLEGVLDVRRAWDARRRGEDPAPHLTTARERLHRQQIAREASTGRACEVLASTLELYERGALP